MDPVDIYVGRRIKARRLLLGLSQSDLGKVIGVSFQQVQKYETGTNRVGAGNLYRISEKFGVTTDYFFEDLRLDDSTPKPVEVNLFDVGDTQMLTALKAFAAIKDPTLRDRIVGLLKSIGQESGT